MASSKAVQGLKRAADSALLKASPRSLVSLTSAAAGCGAGAPFRTFHAQDDRPRIERLGPVISSEKGASATQGGKKRHWTDEPAPAGTVPPTSPLPGVPQLVPGRSLPAPKVQISTLPNGLRVASQETYSQVATFALFIDAGSMYEAGEEEGACHFLEATAFKGTATRTSEDILAYCQKHGISTAAVFNREVVMFKVDTLRTALQPALALLHDAALRPRFSELIVNEARQVIAYQRDEALSQPQVLVSEHLYTAAYGQGTPLGRKEKASDESIVSMRPDVLSSYHSKYFTAPRMVLSAVGVDHATAVEAARALFGSVPTGSASANSGAAGAVLGRPSSPYLGGDVRSSPDWSAVPASAAASAAASKTEFTHIMMAFPTCGWSHDDVVPVCVVDTLLGGGSSFSAGGPGKGMYSRLYREVLNAFAWVESANAFSTQLYDCGLVGIYGAAPPANALDLSTVLASHLARLCEQPVREEELRRARNQLASSVLMNLETRGLLAEDIGRQILSHGKRLEVEELCRRIQAVTPHDLMRVTREALAHPPSFAAVGDVTGLPEYEAYRDYFATVAARFRENAGAAFVSTSSMR